MRERVCKNCGGRDYKIVGQNMVKCSFCGTIYVDEQASKEEEVLLVGANELLRELRFDEASEEFDKILALFPMSFSAYFGKALAKNKIVVYGTGRGISKTPRFFDEIKSIADDEDFKKAMQYAPSDVAKGYLDISKKVDRAVSNYQKVNQKYDVFLCDAAFDKAAPNDQISKVFETLKEKNYNVYFPQNLETREKEAESFNALKTAKVFLYVVKNPKDFYLGEIKNYYDRYFYQIAQRLKAKSSFVLLLDSQKTPKQTLPKELASCKNAIDLSENSFLQDVLVTVGDEMKNSVFAQAKLEHITVEKKDPKRREFVETTPVTMQELGNYKIENLEPGETNKIKWIFLSLKNGDFASAQELAQAELEKDPNNAELLFALLLCEKNINTKEQFFENISNFDDREKIDRILTFSNREFAEYFIDNWENLIIKLANVDYYNKYLLYLAKYNTPNRENFVENAQNLAVETLNDDLIKKVLCCFAPTDVDKFINLYFMLAQKSDNHEYYEKILNLDQGHEQSQIAVFLDKFKDDESKLTFRDKEMVEKVFAYLKESTRDGFIAQIVGLVLSVAYKNIDEAEKQLDFYLSYITNEETLVAVLKNIAEKFQNMGYFKQAEKYLAIAISKQPQNADLYWEILKTKAHCDTDNDVILSPIKISQFPEWNSLLAVANEEQTEKYAQIISKANLYKGEKENFREEALDKDALKVKLNEFIIRNNQILLDYEKQYGLTKSIGYFKGQLKPFENYLEKLDKATTFDEFKEVSKQIDARLSALNLKLSSSISVLNLREKQPRDETPIIEIKKEAPQKSQQKKDIKNDKFLKLYLFAFFELAPLVLSTTIFALLISNPKRLYMTFSHTFLLVLVGICVCIGFGNLIVFLLRRRQISKLARLGLSVMICLSMLNFIMFVSANNFVNPVIEINNETELSTLMKNATSSKLKLTKNIEVTDWIAHDFHGEFDGAGFEIKIKFADKQQNGFVLKNSGKIENLKLNLTETTLKNCQKLGFVVCENSGDIISCEVIGKVNIDTSKSAVVGGIAAKNNRNIENIVSSGEIKFVSNLNDSCVGGVVGVAENGSTISKSSSYFVFDFDGSVKNSSIGGLCGQLVKLSSGKICENFVSANVQIKGTANNLNLGGLIGEGFAESENNFVQGQFVLDELGGSGYVGGLYGKYLNSNLKVAIEHSYSNVDITSAAGLKTGSLVGCLGGKISYCFACNDNALIGESRGAIYADLSTCLKKSELSKGFYDESLDFDQNIWKISDIDYPKFK